MRIAIGTIGILMLASSVTVQAQILKCVGKDGRIEFATSCPPGAKQQDTGVSSKPAAVPAAKEGQAKGAAPTLTDRDAEFRKRQADQKEAATKAEQKSTESQEQQRACEAARANLQALKDRQRMYRVDPKTGERVNYEDADYDRELPITERQVTQNCKG